MNCSDRIIFSEPDYAEFKKKGNKCVDMHYHTIYSDGAATVDQILEKIRKRGIGVAITDHCEIKGSLEILEKKDKEDFIIPGIEVTSDENVDVLFYFYDKQEMIGFFNKEILPKRVKMIHATKIKVPLSYVMNLENKYNCITSLPHPFGYALRTGAKNLFEKHEDILKHNKVFEAINGGNNRKQNLRAIEYIEKYDKGFTGGSDGHSIYPLGNILTCTKADTVKEFLDNIKLKKNKVIGIETKHGKFGELSKIAMNKIRNIFRK